MAQTRAWLLTLGNGTQTAIGHHHIVEYVAIDKVEIKKLPLTYEYAPGVIIRNDEVLPLIDLAPFISPKQKIKEPITGLMVVTYQEAPGEHLKNAGLILRAAPEEISVTSEMACALPKGSSAWNALAQACFNNAGTVTPVLQLERAFGAELSTVYTEKIKKLKATQKAKSNSAAKT